LIKNDYVKAIFLTDGHRRGRAGIDEHRWSKKSRALDNISFYNLFLIYRAAVFGGVLPSWQGFCMEEGTPDQKEVLGVQVIALFLPFFSRDNTELFTPF
jgi:hypothetical protein